MVINRKVYSFSTFSLEDQQSVDFIKQIAEEEGITFSALLLEIVNKHLSDKAK